MKKFGFGAMRLPLKNAEDAASIDQEKLNQMVNAFLDAVCAAFCRVIRQCYDGVKRYERFGTGGGKYGADEENKAAG